METTINNGKVEETISRGTSHCPPWLLISHGEHLEKQSFYDTSGQKLYTTSIPQLQGKCVVDSAYGWLILLDYWTNKYRLWNPSSTEIIELPKLEYSYRFSSCTLSKPPTDSDCHILFISRTCQAFCRIGDAQYAINQHNHILEASISFKGEIYGIKITPCTEFVTVHFNFAEETLELKPLMTEEGEVWKLDVESPPWVRFTNYYLVESLRANEIFLVEKMSSDIFDQTAFKVFRTDFHVRKFVEIYNLGGEAIFLGPKGGGSCCSSQGIQPNCIYYTVKGSRNLYIYDLNDQSTSLVLPCPDAPRKQSMTYWVQPEVFHA